MSMRTRVCYTTNNIRPTVPSKAAAGAERRGAVRAAPARGESDRVRLEGALSALSCGEEEDLQSDAETLSGPQALSSQSPAKAWKGVAGEVQQGTPPSLKAEKKQTASDGNSCSACSASRLAPSDRRPHLDSVRHGQALIDEGSHK